MLTKFWHVSARPHAKHVAPIDSRSVLVFEGKQFRVLTQSVGGEATVCTGDYTGGVLRVLRARLVDKKSGVVEVRLSAD